MNDRSGLLALAPRHALMLAGLVVFVVLGVEAVRKLTEWGDVYIRAAGEFLAGADIYRTGRAYAYPPFPVLLAIPFIRLSDVAERIVFYLVNVVAMIALARSAWKFTGGGRLAIGGDRRALAIAFVGLMTIAAYALNTLEHGQTDLIIDAAAAAGCYWVWRGQPAGAALIGLAAAFKGPPLVFAAYFLACRRWSEAAFVALTPIALNLLPDLVRPGPGGGLWVDEWVRRYVAPHQALTTPLGSWASALIYNQSLGGSIQRLVNTHLVAAPHGLNVVSNALQVPAPWLKLVAYGAMAAMLGVTLARAAGPARAEPPGAPPRMALECGAMFALMLLMSPMSGLAHFPALAIPVLCAGRLAIRDGWAPAGWTAAFALAAALAVNKDLVGAAGYDLALWSGVTTASAISLWALCIAATFRKEPRVVVQAQPATA